jgi:hypothetical protein
MGIKCLKRVILEIDNDIAESFVHCFEGFITQVYILQSSGGMDCLRSLFCCCNCERQRRGPMSISTHDDDWDSTIQFDHKSGISQSSLGLSSNNSSSLMEASDISHGQFVSQIQMKQIPRSMQNVMVTDEDDDEENIGHEGTAMNNSPTSLNMASNSKHSFRQLQSVVMGNNSYSEAGSSSPGKPFSGGQENNNKGGNNSSFSRDNNSTKLSSRSAASAVGVQGVVSRYKDDPTEEDKTSMSQGQGNAGNGTSTNADVNNGDNDDDEEVEISLL